MWFFLDNFIFFSYIQIFSDIRSDFVSDQSGWFEDISFTSNNTNNFAPLIHCMLSDFQRNFNPVTW